MQQINPHIRGFYLFCSDILTYNNYYSILYLSNVNINT